MATASNPNYYIVPNAIAVTPNSYQNNPQYCIIGTSFGAAIRITNMWSEKTHDGQTVDIGYAASLQYKTRKMSGGQYALGTNCEAKDCHVYIRIPKADAERADFIFTDKVLDILGQYLTATPTQAPVSEASASALSSMGDTYYYVRLCTLKYDATTNIRTVTNLDTGILQTAKGENQKNAGDFDKMFRLLDNAYISILLPLANLLFSNAKDSREVNITNIMTSAYEWATSLINDATMATTGWIAKHFLSKSHADSTPYTLTLEAGADFGKAGTDTEYVDAVKGCKIFWNGSGWQIDTDYLNVNKKMYAKEIEVNKVSHVGGQQLLTSASCIADHVEEIKENDTLKGWRVYFLAEDSEGRKVTNDWMPGDLAYCQTFNIDSVSDASASAQNFKNKYYWRLVTNVSTQVTDGFHFIDLSNLICDDAGTMAMTGHTDNPEAEDRIVQFGFMSSFAPTDTDAATIKERQGATMLSGAGRYKRSLIMWEKIYTFMIPTPRIYLSPQRIDMIVNSLSIVVEDGDETNNVDIKDYVTSSFDGRIIINGDDAAEPTLEDSFIASLLDAVFGDDASSHSIADLIGAVYITTEKMFYMLTYDEATTTYSWTEDTDGTLKALYDKTRSMQTIIDDILDDAVITENEIPDFKKIKADYENKVEQVEDEYAYATSSGALESAKTQFDTANEDFGIIIGEIFDLTPPIYFSGYKDSTLVNLNVTRDEFISKYQYFEDSFRRWQSAFADSKLNSISESAAQQAIEDAKEYVTNEVQSIVSAATEGQIKSWALQACEGTFVSKSVYNSDKTSISLYNQWIDSTFPERVGGTGLWTKLNNMFVGTQTITFDANGKISNISTNGLATSAQLAALSSRVTDAEGKILSEATIATWISQSFNSTTNASNLKSHMLLSADDISISSGDKNLGNYFSLSNGRLLAQSITVNGYIQTNFIDINTAGVATKNGSQWTITNYLNLIVHSQDDSPRIILPTDASYIGSHIILYENDSRSDGDDEVVTIITDNGSDIINTGTEININLIQFYGGYIDFIGVKDSNGKTAWMIYNFDTKYQLYGIKSISGGLGSKICKVISVDDAQILIGNGFVNIKNKEGANIIASRTSASLKIGGTTLVVEDGSIKVIDNNPNTLTSKTTKLFSRS